MNLFKKITGIIHSRIAVGNRGIGDVNAVKEIITVFETEIFNAKLQVLEEVYESIDQGSTLEDVESYLTKKIQSFKESQKQKIV